MAEIVTQTLTAAEMRGEVALISAWLVTQSQAEVEVLYGFGCSEEVIWTTRKIAPDALPQLVTDSERENLFELGIDDLFIRNGDQTIEFQLCNDSDIHLKTENAKLLEQVRESWAENGWKVYQSR